MAWELLTAISVVTLSISVLLQRVLLHKDKSDPIAYVVIFNGLVATFIALYALLKGFAAPDFARFWFPIAAAAFLFGAGHVAYAKTLQRVEASVFSILFATNAIWVMLFGVFLFREHIGLAHLLGTLLIFASVGMLAERSGQLKVDKGITLGLLTGLLFGLATVCWVYVGKYSDAASWTAISFGLTTLVVLITHPKAATKMKPFLESGKLTKISLLGLLFSISAVTLLTAFQSGKVSIIAPLQQTNIIVTLLLAITFLHEHKRLWRKAAAATVCFLGVLLIV